MHSQSAPEALSRDLDQLRPALEGFPVDALVTLYVSAPELERDATLKVVDLCLLRWIGSLNDTIQATPHAPGDEVLRRLQERQEGARDALVQLKSKLSCHVVHRNSGQAC